MRGDDHSNVAGVGSPKLNVLPRAPPPADPVILNSVLGPHFVKAAYLQH